MTFETLIWCLGINHHTFKILDDTHLSTLKVLSWRIYTWKSQSVGKHDRSGFEKKKFFGWLMSEIAKLLSSKIIIMLLRSKSRSQMFASNEIIVYDEEEVSKCL